MYTGLLASVCNDWRRGHSFMQICPVRSTQGDIPEKERDVDPVTATYMYM